jgi:hypothetical protein
VCRQRVTEVPELRVHYTSCSASIFGSPEGAEVFIFGQGSNFSGPFSGTWYCGSTAEGNPQITPEQGKFCVDLLKQAAASQEVPCL